MDINPIIIRYKGQGSLKEAYDVSLKDFKMVARVAILTGTYDDAWKIKMKMVEIAAYADQRMFELTRPELVNKTKKRETELELDKIFQDSGPQPWTIQNGATTYDTE